MNNDATDKSNKAGFRMDRETDGIRNFEPATQSGNGKKSANSGLSRDAERQLETFGSRVNNNPAEKELFRGQFFRPVPSPELDRSVLACAHQARLRRQFRKRLTFTLLPAAAALAIGFGVIFAEHPGADSASRPATASELSGLWDWSNLENEGADLTANLEYAGAALASL